MTKIPIALPLSVIAMKIALQYLLFSSFRVPLARGMKDYSTIGLFYFSNKDHTFVSASYCVLKTGFSKPE
jgi:hypothetical protein